MEESHRSSVQWNKHCKPPPEPSRIHLACILCDGNLPELWGIYEWRAIPQDQPNRDRVVFVGCICCAIIPFFRCSKMLGEAGKQAEFYNKCFENSRSQIVFRTYIFPKIVIGCPCKQHIFIKFNDYRPG